MAILIKRKEHSLAPAGLHHARIIRIIDLGTQTENYQGKIKNNPKVLIMFEYMNKKREDGTNETISQEYTAIAGEKANFQKAFKTLDSELFAQKEFDISPLLGRACAITVAHITSKSSGNQRAKVESVSPPMDGVDLLPAVSEPKLFDLSAPDWKLFAEFGEWVSEKIRKSPEYAALKLPENAPPPLNNLVAAEPAKMPVSADMLQLLEQNLKTGVMKLEQIAQLYDLTEQQRLHLESI